MLEQLMGLIQDHSQDAIVNNPAIPNQNNNDAMQTILQSVMGGLQDRRPNGVGQQDPDKVLILTGTNLLGGIDILSF